MLARALKMPHDERVVRMNALRNREKINDVHLWMKNFLKAIEDEGESRRIILYVYSKIFLKMRRRRPNKWSLFKLMISIICETMLETRQL